MPVYKHCLKERPSLLLREGLPSLVMVVECLPQLSLAVWGSIFQPLGMKESLRLYNSIAHRLGVSIEHTCSQN